jgi:hypothetical protein
MPITIKMPSAASSQRSTVHHHSAKGLRTARWRKRSRWRDISARELAEAVAAFFEIGELIVGGTGRRQKHDGLLRVGLRSIVSGVIDRNLKRTAHVASNDTLKRTGEIVCRGADEVCGGDAREERTQGLDAALFALAARNPVNWLEGRQRLLRRVCIGRFRIIDEENTSAPADFFHAMWQAGKALERPLHPRAITGEIADCRDSGGRVLRIVATA